MDGLFVNFVVVDGLVGDLSLSVNWLFLCLCYIMFVHLVGSLFC